MRRQILRGRCNIPVEAAWNSVDRNGPSAKL
ncbi:hypothetical protein AK812_SmicGene48133, partial [Symbiodinium microadriaticum]